MRICVKIFKQNNFKSSKIYGYLKFPSTQNNFSILKKLFSQKFCHSEPHKCHISPPKEKPNKKFHKTQNDIISNQAKKNLKNKSQANLKKKKIRIENFINQNKINKQKIPAQSNECQRK